MSIVLYPGDYLAHEFKAKFEAAGGGGPEAYRDFVIKTMSFVSKRLEDAFPQAPVYNTLGNADSICGDYMIAPGQTFLAAVGELWARASAHPEAFADFGIGGFYAVPHPRVHGRDLIVLNNVFWSANYGDRCNPEGGDPGAAQLAWLDWTLYRTKLRGRSASLLFHIPLGIDRFNAAHGKGTCRANVTAYLKEAYAQPFLTLLEEYREILGSSCSGHTHMDNFRVVATAAGEPILLTHITPAVSPMPPSTSPISRTPGAARRRNGRSSTRCAAPTATRPITRRRQASWPGQSAPIRPSATTTSPSTR